MVWFGLFGLVWFGLHCLVWFGLDCLVSLVCIISIPYPTPSMMDGCRPAMMDGRPAGYDGWTATVHDGWMETPQQNGRWAPKRGAPAPGAPPFLCCFHPSIMDGGHPSIIAGRPSIHHRWCWIWTTSEKQTFSKQPRFRFNVWGKLKPHPIGYHLTIPFN